MTTAPLTLASAAAIQVRADELLCASRQANAERTDRLFAVLMLGQWIGGIVLALVGSPLSWAGAESQVHSHVFAAVGLGGLIAALPIGLAFLLPGREITRQVIAVSQMLTSALLIHLSGGRIETHFHVFGSLAFLAFYRDWKVLVTATVVIAIDHFWRGIYWPRSVFGDEVASVWRAAEHAGWVVFEDIFLLRMIWTSNQEMRDVAERRAELESTNEKIVDTVTHVSDAADAVAASSNQLTATASQLSGDASRQSSSVTETSVSVERIAEAINRSAKNAQKTDSIARQCSVMAVDGSAAVKDTIRAMQDIEEQIRSVQDIVQSTDLLALNAEVQAARVGEQGKGFMVVAYEIRRLADDARKTAKKIGQRSSESVQVAERAGDLLDQIVPAVQSTAELVQSIAHSAVEQGRSLDEMKVAMGQLEETSLRNASMSEQLSATAVDMDSHVAKLQLSMSTLSRNGRVQDPPA